MTPDASISFVDLGKLSKPATTLINRISNAAGILFEPRQIKRVAKAKAEAARIEADSKVAIAELYGRAVRRRIEEEAQYQKNMEDIIAKALPQLDENAKPDSMENDWIVNFFDKSRIVSDNEMQSLWARLLAGEANAPGAFSKRTVNSIADLDKREAVLFTQLCGFVCRFRGRPIPLVLGYAETIYNKAGINFETLSQLESIGLIQRQDITQYKLTGLSKRCPMAYYGRVVSLEPSEDNINVGNAILTRIGMELVPICGSKPVDGFWEYVMERLKGYLPEARD